MKRTHVNTHYDRQPCKRGQRTPFECVGKDAAHMATVCVYLQPQAERRLCAWARMQHTWPRYVFATGTCRVERSVQRIRASTLYEVYG